MKDIQNRKDIEFLVDTFYTQLLVDDLIGVFFTDVIKLNWEIHIPIMYDFWEMILLGGTTYKGNPMLKHIQLNNKKALDATHFDRWLSIWEKTIQENYQGERADMAIQRANNIGALMQFKIKTA